MSSGHALWHRQGVLHTACGLLLFVAGALPPSWGAPEALPNLSYRVLLFNNSELQGTIPSSWAAPGSPFVERNISL